ncbi:MAG: hypothetical protein IOC54_01660 [Methylobacterium sp.]|nr:hypothetical protein [Methylobacterium sp.]MCA3650527.1 hypothetical protein [Methylobacterium sp.]MCA4921789.1 hypothetical protein [Methylobacterium sp.]
MNSIDRLIPFSQAIAMAGMKSTKGYDEVRAGRLAIVKNGNRTFVRESEIRRYIEELETAPSNTHKRAA